jgi:hypothetical protein
MQLPHLGRHVPCAMTPQEFAVLSHATAAVRPKSQPRASRAITCQRSARCNAPENARRVARPSDIVDSPRTRRVRSPLQKISLRRSDFELSHNPLTARMAANIFERSTITGHAMPTRVGALFDVTDIRPPQLDLCFLSPRSSILQFPRSVQVTTKDAPASSDSP